MMRALALALMLAGGDGLAAVITEQMTLIDAIEAVRRQGVQIGYSTRLVKPWMRVRQTPSSGDEIGGLREALAAYGLTLDQDSTGQWLVVEGEPYEVEPLPQQADSVADPARQDQFSQAVELIKVTASRHGLYSFDAGTEQFLSGEEIRSMPHIADDVFRAFHRLPGAAASDFSAPFNLRGGVVDEVKVLLDGLELFEPFHMRTLFNPLSIVDPGIIADVNVMTGGYTVENGNHMSGVIDIDSRSNTGEPVHELGVSFLNAFVRSSGAMGRRGSYQVSARRGYLDLLADSVAVDDEEFSPRYGDVFAGLTYAISDSTQLDAHALMASDHVSFENPQERELGEADGSLYYIWLSTDTEFANRIGWRNMVSTGRVEYRDDGNSRNLPAEYIDRHYQRDVDVGSLQSDLSIPFHDDHLLQLGFRYRQLLADYDYSIDSYRQSDYYNAGTPLIIRRDIVTSREGGEYGAYARYRFRPTPRQTWELGLRWDKQTYTETDDDSQLSPRLNAVFNLSRRTDLRIGWGHFHQPQGIHMLQVEDGIDYYHPASRAEQIVAGLQHEFQSGIELQLDVYHKDYTDPQPRYENALDSFEYAPESDFDRVLVDPESASARGVELTLRDRVADNLDWWLNYTWSMAEDVIDGESVPRSWDQRHAVTASVTWRFGDWRLSAVGRYHSGWPRTPLVLVPVFDEDGVLVGVDGDLSQRNQANYDDYLRFDLRLSRRWVLQKSSFELYVEVFNLFDTENQCCVAGHELSVGTGVTASPDYDSYLPFFPSFGFVWTFGPGANQAD